MRNVATNAGRGDGCRVGHLRHVVHRIVGIGIVHQAAVVVVGVHHLEVAQVE